MQTVRLAAGFVGLTTPKLYLFNSAGVAVGDAAGYVLTETPASSAHYVASVADAVTGDSLVAQLRANGTIDVLQIEYLTLTGETGAVAIAGPVVAVNAVSSGTLSALAAALLGNGLYQLTVNVETAAGAPIPNARVALYDGAGDPLGIYGLTSSGGAIVFFVDNGTYQVGVTAGPGYEPADPTETNIFDGNESTTITLASLATVAPELGGLCAITCTTRHDAEYAVGAVITAQLAETNQVLDSDLLSRAVTTAKSDDNGYAVLYLVRGKQYTVTQIHRGHPSVSATITVPDAATATMAALVSA